MTNSNKLFQDSDYLIYLNEIITESRKSRFEEVLQNRTKHFTVVTEDVYQLHNTSAVMRSCEVFGIQELHVIEQKYGKSIDKEIAMGAEKWVDIHRYNSNASCVAALRAQGYQIVVTTPHAQAHNLNEFDISQPSALFFGTERSGVSSEVMQQADAYIKIPMVGFTESLNISVSAAIILQNISERLRNSSVKWGLSDTEMLEKRIDWARKTIKDIDRITQRYLESKKD